MACNSRSALFLLRGTTAARNGRPGGGQSIRNGIRFGKTSTPVRQTVVTVCQLRFFLSGTEETVVLSFTLRKVLHSMPPGLGPGLTRTRSAGTSFHTIVYTACCRERGFSLIPSSLRTYSISVSVAMLEIFLFYYCVRIVSFFAFFLAL